MERIPEGFHSYIPLNGWFLRFLERSKWRVLATVEDTKPLDIYLWLLVLTAMTLDIGLTLFGLSIGLIEQNPIALFGIQTFGYAVLAFLKAPAIIIGFVGWVLLSPTYRQLNLVGLALPWIQAVIVNSWLIITN